MNRQSHTHSPPRHPGHPPPSVTEKDGFSPRTEACRLAPQSTIQSAPDRPDLTSLKLLQQHQVRRADPGRDQQQREHQRGWC